MTKARCFGCHEVEQGSVGRLVKPDTEPKVHLKGLARSGAELSRECACSLAALQPQQGAWPCVWGTGIVRAGSGICTLTSDELQEGEALRVLGLRPELAEHVLLLPAVSVLASHHLGTHQRVSVRTSSTASPALAFSPKPRHTAALAIPVRVQGCSLPTPPAFLTASTPIHAAGEFSHLS